MAGKQKLLGVQYLRAIAALMVAYYHLQNQIPGFTADLSFDHILDSAHLSSGVYVFFVISGFIMYVTARELTPAEFAKRRLLRILPLYWAMTLAVCSIALIAPRVLHRTDVSADYLAKSLLFVPYANPTQRGLLFPILVPGWSLNYEMVFYALFALALLAPARWRMWILCGVICSCVVAGFLRSRPEMLSVWGFYTSNRLMLFVAGVGLATIYKSLRLSKFACTALGVIGLWMILGDWSTRELTRLAQSAGSVAIVTGAVAWECQHGLPRWNMLLLLGDASYSIYLVHLFAIGVTRSLWPHLPLYGALGAMSFAAASMLATVLLALVTYRFIECPALSISSHRRRTMERRQGESRAEAPL